MPPDAAGITEPDQQPSSQGQSARWWKWVNITLRILGVSLALIWLATTWFGDTSASKWLSLLIPGAILLLLPGAVVSFSRDVRLALGRPTPAWIMRLGLAGLYAAALGWAGLLLLSLLLSLDIAPDVLRARVAENVNLWMVPFGLALAIALAGAASSSIALLASLTAGAVRKARGLAAQESDRQ